MKTSEPKKILEIKPTPKINVYVTGEEVGIYHYAVEDTVLPNIKRQKMILDIESAREVAFAIAEYLSKENLK